jgi:hypothetical protein
MSALIPIGCIVKRNEGPAGGDATVIGMASGLFQTFYHIEYEEGGSGWWPADSLELVTEQAP